MSWSNGSVAVVWAVAHPKVDNRRRKVCHFIITESPGSAVN